MSAPAIEPPNAVERGEVNCFGCQVRTHESQCRKARLAKPAGLYCDGVEVWFCSEERCEQQAEQLDAKYGKPDGT